jgi:hypothetical protein
MKIFATLNKEKPPTNKRLKLGNLAAVKDMTI